MATDPQKYKFNHSMLRVKDPKQSIKFYEFLGMKVINTIKNADSKFDLYFLAYDSAQSVSPGKHWTDREGIVELTHNYGTEANAEYKINNGNSDPYRGFGHICILVDNIQAACKRIEDAGYGFQKKLSDGKMHHIAFAKDPDGYWVEIISRKPIEESENITETDVDAYRMNHTMIRVKDAVKSLAFYTDTIGMKIHRTVEMKAASFNLYFLGYEHQDHPTEGLLELTWNYGTEKDNEFKYHNGNTEPQGFGHICISVDDIDAACNRFEEKGVDFKKRLTDGSMKNIAFILDPDGYWIEIVQNEAIKKYSGW